MVCFVLTTPAFLGQCTRNLLHKQKAILSVAAADVYEKDQSSPLCLHQNHAPITSELYFDPSQTPMSLFAMFSDMVLQECGTEQSSACSNTL
jgi:hypothetical protein